MQHEFMNNSQTRRDSDPQPVRHSAYSQSLPRSLTRKAIEIQRLFFSGRVIRQCVCDDIIEIK